MRRALVVLALAACPGPRTERRDPPPVADDVPVLAIASPVRGAFVDGTELNVTGRVRDEGAVRVTVNGAEAKVAPDGTFTATLTVAPGMTIIDTHAIDATDHDVRDVRAVLVGPFAKVGDRQGSVDVRLGREGVALLGKALAASAKAIDLSTAAKVVNPVYENPGCLGAKVDIANVTVGAIDIAMVPRADALHTTVTVDDIAVRLGVDYEVACIGGSTSMTVTTRARFESDLGVKLTDREVRTAFRSPAVTLDVFRIDIGGVPGPIEKLLRGVIRVSVERALTKAIASKLPPYTDAMLTELLAGPPRPALLGRDLTIELVPRRLEISSQGLHVAAGTKLVVAGGEGTRFVTTPISDIPVASDADLRIALSIDTLNQVLAGLWAARAFDRTITRDSIGPLAMLLDDRVHSIDITFSLPPTIGANLELAVGDLVISARDAAGGDLQRFAVSLRSALAAKPGALALATTEPTVHAQLLGQTIESSLDSAGLEGIVKGAWALVANRIDDALARIPVPGVTGAALQIKAVSARAGWVVLDLTSAR